MIGGSLSPIAFALLFCVLPRLSAGDAASVPLRFGDFASIAPDAIGPPDLVASGLMRKPIFPFAIVSVAISPDGNLLAGVDGTGLVRIWDRASGKLRDEIKAHAKWAFSIVWSGDGTSLMTGGGDTLIQQYDTGNFKKAPRTFRSHTNDVHSIVLSRNGRIMISSGDDARIIVWDVQDARAIHILTGHERQIPSVALSPDEMMIASGSRDHTIRLWDLRSGVLRDTLIGHAADVMCVRFSPDGSLIASGGWDYTARLWDVHTGKAVRVLLGNPNWVPSVAFSADGQRLATASGNILRVRDTSTGKEAWELRQEGKIPINAEAINEDLSMIAFSPDGTRIVVGSTIGAIYEIDAGSGKQVREFRANQIPSRPKK